VTRTLMVTKWLPLPANDGGKLRALAVLRALAERGEVVLFGFDDGTVDYDGLQAMGVEVHGEPRPRSLVQLVRAIVRTGSLSAARFYSRTLAAEVEAAAATKSVDALVIEYLQMAPYGEGIKADRRLLDMHNIESSLVRTFSRVRGGLTGALARMEVALLRRQERRVMSAYDAVVVVSETDRARLPSGTADVLLCPNGCDDRPALPVAAEPVAVFIALMGWTPNADAAAWLVTDVWPLVQATIPHARLQLIGRDPTSSVRDLAGPGVEVTGTVPEVLPYLEKATVALAPLRMGGGSRLKVLEALSSGRPVVATSVGVEGLEDLIGRGVVVGDRPDELAQHIIELLADFGAAARLGSVGRDTVRQRYLWNVTLRPLVTCVSPIPGI
jgi:glycosyltransferase involved in cell wall biosynthesis